MDCGDKYEPSEASAVTKMRFSLCGYQQDQKDPDMRPQKQTLCIPIPAGSPNAINAGPMSGICTEKRDSNG